MGATDLNGPTKYRYSDLKAATKNFNEKNKLGEGGFGAVYKVNLSFSSHFNNILRIFFFFLIISYTFSYNF